MVAAPLRGPGELGLRSHTPAPTKARAPGAQTGSSVRREPGTLLGGSGTVSAPVLWLLALAALWLVVCTLAAPRHPTEWDSANYCLGVLHFDIRQHAPHPPGYLLYVLTGRLLTVFTGDPHRSLVLLSHAMGACAVVPIYLLARMFLAQRASLWATALALLNPVALFYGSVALSAISGLLFAPAVLWLTLRGRAGAPRLLVLAGLVLGVSGGFRQDILVFLAVPWALCVLFQDSSLRHKALSVAALLAGTASWLVPTVVLSGGLGPYLEACAFVRSLASRESITLDGSVLGFSRNLVRLGSALLAGTGLLGVGALALLERSARRRLAAMERVRFWTIALALALPLLFFLFVFIHKPGYLLLVLPVLTIVLFAGLVHRELGRGGGWLRRVPAASGLLGLAFFLAFPSSERITARLLGHLTFHERSSLALRLVRQFARLTRDEIAFQDALVEDCARALAPLREAGGDVSLVTLDDNRPEFRVCMLEFPRTRVFHLRLSAGRVTSAEVASGLEFRSLEPSPGEPLRLGAQDGTVVWITTYTPEIRASLEGAGGVPLESLRSVLVRTAGGAQPLLWAD